MNINAISSDSYTDIFQIKSLTINTNDARLFEYLAVNLSDFYEVTHTETCDKTYSIFCISSDIEAFVPNFDQASIITHTSPSNHEIYTKRHYQENEVEYYLDESSQFVVIDDISARRLSIISSPEKFLKNCKSVIRDQILYGYEQLKPSILVHGAGVSDENRGIMIIGNKRAGKTTTLINLLRNQFDFCANDLSFVIEKNHTLFFKGAPESIRIGIGTLSTCPELVTLIDDPKILNQSQNELFISETKYEIEWEELAQIFKQEVKNGWSKLDFILCPKLDVVQEKFSIRFLKDDEKKIILADTIISKNTKSQGFWLNSMRHLANDKDNDIIYRLIKQIEELPFVEFKYSGKKEEIEDLLQVITDIS